MGNIRELHRIGKATQVVPAGLHDAHSVTSSWERAVPSVSQGYKSEARFIPQLCAKPSQLSKVSLG